MPTPAWLGSAHENPNLAEARAAAERTTQGATRASEVIGRIRSLINKAAPERAPVQINEVIEEIVALAERQALEEYVSVADRTCARPARGAWRQNSVAAGDPESDDEWNRSHDRRSPTGRGVAHSVADAKDADQIRVSVQDSGIGVSRRSYGPAL